MLSRPHVAITTCGTISHRRHQARKPPKMMYVSTVKCTSMVASASTR